MATPHLAGVTLRTIDTETLRFHIAESGPRDAPLVVLLHGFPEFWYSWRRQLAHGDAGLHLVAPDLRGYGGTDKPTDGYDLETLAGDVRALIRALHREQGRADGRATVVGHDWGGAVAWSVAALYPEVVRSLVILNAPHPIGFQQTLVRHPSQFLRSWYIALFQVPGLAEHLIRCDPRRAMARALNGAAGRPGLFSAEDIQAYADAITAPGVLESALAYYRAIPRSMLGNARLGRAIAAPVLVLWGGRDPALGPQLVDAARKFVRGRFATRFFESAGHWLQQEEPEAVWQAIAGWVSPRPEVAMVA